MNKISKSKGDVIMQDLTSYMKNLQQQRQIQNDEIAQTIIDKKNILKLFNYKRWTEFMGWVKEKLQESGEDFIVDQKGQKERQQQLSSQRSSESDNIQIKGQNKRKIRQNSDQLPQKGESLQNGENGIVHSKKIEQEQYVQNQVQDALSQIVQQPDQQQSLKQNVTQEQNIIIQSIKIAQSINLKNPTLQNRAQQQNKFEQQCQILALQNAKLRKQLIRLKDYVVELQSMLNIAAKVK